MIGVEINMIGVEIYGNRFHIFLKKIINLFSYE
jgi:hypothetical protein